MPGPFAPTISADVAYESPVAPVKAAPTFLEGALDLASKGVQVYGQSTKSTRSSGTKADPVFAKFAEQIQIAEANREKLGEGRYRSDLKNIVTNFGASGYEIDKEKLDYFEQVTGRSAELYFGMDPEQKARETLYADPKVQALAAPLIAEGMDQFEAYEKSIARIQENTRLDQTIIEIKSGGVKKYLSDGGREAQRKQTAANIGGMVDMLRKGIMSGQATIESALRIKALVVQHFANESQQIPVGVPEELRKVYEDENKKVLDGVDALVKLTESPTLLQAVTQKLLIAKNDEERAALIPQYMILGTKDAVSLATYLGVDIDKVLDAQGITNSNVGLQIDVTKFNQASVEASVNAAGGAPDPIQTTIPKEVADTVDKLSDKELVDWSNGNSKFASAPSLDMGDQGDREKFFKSANSVAAALQSPAQNRLRKATDVAEMFNGTFIKHVNDLLKTDPANGEVTRSNLDRGLFREGERRRVQLSSIEQRLTNDDPQNQVPSATYNSRTGKYELTPEFIASQRPEDIAAFNKGLALYRGDLAEAAKGNFSRLSTAFPSGFAGGDGTKVVSNGNLIAIAEAVNNRKATATINAARSRLMGISLPPTVEEQPEFPAEIDQPTTGEARRIAAEIAGRGTPEPTPAPETTSGITEPLLDTLVQIESSGDPNAVSTKGAVGLYQIRPSTAADPGFNVTPLSTGSDVASASPEEQRRFARDYLKAMSDRYNGDMALALAAYNGGYGRVDDFVANGTALPKETVDYVQKFVTQGALPKDNSVSSGRPKLDVPADGNVKATQGSMLGDVGGFVTSILGALVDAGIPKAQAEEALSKVPMPPIRPEEAGGTAPMSPSQRRIAAAQARQQARAEEYEEMNSTPLTIVPAMGRAVIGDILRNQLGISQEDITRTEDYFSPEELGVIRGLIEKGLKGDKTQGSISYQDYTTKGKDLRFANDLLPEKLIDPEFSVKTTLGQFNWKIDDRGHLIVTDKYDFNDAKDLQEANPDFSDKIDNIRKYAGRPDIGTYGIIRRAAALFGSKEGEGVNFELDLGPAKSIPLPPKRGEERSLGFNQGWLDSAIESATLAGVASTVLDFVPVVGEIKGGVELIEQYQEDKDPVMAGINLAALALGVVPGVGDAAGKALKGAAPKLVEEASKFVDEFLEGKINIPQVSNEIPPKKTVTVYRLNRVKKNDDNLYPLFVDPNTPVPVGKWVKAIEGEAGTSAGKVKSKLGDLAYRPGWHASLTPRSTHIGGKLKGETEPSWRPADQVWVEAEMPDDFDWQSVANSRASVVKSGKNKGKLNVKEAHITDQIPFGGHYKYKTNPNMEGEWLVSGDLKVNRRLTADEIKKGGDLPTLPELIEQRNLTVKDLPKSAMKELKDYYPETFEKMLRTE